MAENLALLSWYAFAVSIMNKTIRFFCQNETRIGLKTISGRKITGLGGKPKGKVQGQSKATYLYRIVEPKTEEHYLQLASSDARSFRQRGVASAFSTSSAILIVIAFKSFSIRFPNILQIAF